MKTGPATGGFFGARAFRSGLAAAAGLMWIAAAQADYLPQAGPGALRFLASPRPGPPRPVLPPLAAADSAPARPAVPAGLPSPPPPSEPPLPGPVEPLPDWWTAFWESFSAGDAEVLLIAPAPPKAPEQGAPVFDARLTPQMLLRFFKQPPGATNSVDAVVALPPSYFQPPTPVGGASSSATYSAP